MNKKKNIKSNTVNRLEREHDGKQYRMLRKMKYEGNMHEKRFLI